MGGGKQNSWLPEMTFWVLHSGVILLFGVSNRDKRCRGTVIGPRKALGEH